jgi:hypothetical protein
MNKAIVDNGIDIIVRARDDASVKVWLSYNSEWISAYNVKVWRCSPSAQREFAVTPYGGSERDEAAVSEGIGWGHGQRPLLYLSPDWVLRHDWITQIVRAYALRPFSTATGRLVVQAADGRSDLTDITPHRIAEEIKEWFFTPEMHGLVTRKLPDDVLWISADVTHLLRSALTFEDGFEGVAARFYETAASGFAHGLHAYLPDAIAVKVSQ